MNNDAKTFSYLSYVGPLFLIGLFSDIRNDPTLRFHMNQGLVLFLCEVAGMTLHSIVNAFLGGIILLNIIPSLLFFFIGLASLALSLIGIFNVASGKMNPLPIIGVVNLLK
ncbi:MAG: hypothetical protein IJM51_11740 [Clostridia bacterium]|nr:hypothetical protein [Clostridia bacterium]